MAGGMPVGLQWGGPQSIGAVVANSAGTLVTDSGTAGTKGAWAQLIGSTLYDITWLAISITSQASFLTTAFVDIGIGAAGSEMVVISNLMLSITGDDSAPAQYVLPVYIPARTRIAARCMSANGSNNASRSPSRRPGMACNSVGRAGQCKVDTIGITGTTPTGISTPATGAVGAVHRSSSRSRHSERLLRVPARLHIQSDRLGSLDRCGRWRIGIRETHPAVLSHHLGQRRLHGAA